MPIDERAFHELSVESRDLQADAMQDVQGSLPELAEVREERRNQPIDVDEVRNFNDGRRRVMSEGGLGMGQLAARGLLATAFGGVLAGIVATPATADEALDIQILQTASSLEILAVATYGAALKLAVHLGQQDGGGVCDHDDEAARRTQPGLPSSGQGARRQGTDDAEREVPEGGQRHEADAD